MTPEEGLRFVEQHGVVLESARGPVPALAIELVGGPIRGSWWGHEKGHEIFAVCSYVRESGDVLVCKWIEGKVTYVHRRLWPAVVRLADEIGRDRLEEVRSVHTESGKHENVRTPFPGWVPKDAAARADTLSSEAARAQLPEPVKRFLGDGS